MHHVINNLTEEIFLLQLLVKESDFQLNSIEVPKESLFFPFAFPSNGKYHPLYFPAILVNKKLCSSAILYQTCGTCYQEKKFGGSQDGGGIGRVITFSSTNTLKEQQNGEQSLQNNF